MAPLDDHSFVTVHHFKVSLSPPLPVSLFFPLLLAEVQQAYASPSSHQMAPPSPNTAPATTTTSSSNGGGSSGSMGEQLSKTNLYIRGLHPGTTDQDLVKLCQP